jgi:signal transduction histidine kinase/CheY-like chemotaxis protein
LFAQPDLKCRRMKKLQIVIISVFIIIVTIILFLYKSLYNKQISYTSTLLDRQAHLVGLSIDKTNNEFVSDLNKIIFSEDFLSFFTDPDQKNRIIYKLKIYFSRYEDIVTGIKLYDYDKNEFTLRKDETGNNWLEQTYILHSQGEIVSRDTILKEGGFYNYFLPVVSGGRTIGNIVVTVDFQSYFTNLFAEFNLKDYQWQWVISDSSAIIFSNSKEKQTYTGISEIMRHLGSQEPGDLIHTSVSASGKREIVSYIYPAQLLQKNVGLVFSSSAYSFRGYLVRICLFLCLAVLLSIAALVYVFRRRIREQDSEIGKLSATVRMLNDIIDGMPVGIVIHNGRREILKANQAAAEQFSYAGESEMKGMVFPVNAVTDENNYFSRNLGGKFSPEQFIILRKENGETILLKTSLPVIYDQQDAMLEILVDVTMLESERNQEATASTAKSEFLARMSYELRTPLNGIIGMADILDRHKLDTEARSVLGLLRRSAEVLLSIINDILDFSKIESGKMILDEIPFSLREEIVYCYDLARTSIDEDEIRLSCNVAENVPDNLIGDPFRLRQILTNLLNHSIRNSRNGEISLDCSLENEYDNSMVLKFELADTGKSFDRATLDKLFGGRITMDSKVHTEDDGSGFSTILTRQLIELMKGTVSAVSPSGLDGDKGCRVGFTITLYSNEKPVKDLGFQGINGFGDIKTLVITGNQVRDEEILGSLHKLGLSLMVTTYQKSTIGQIRSNLNFPANRYHLIIILDDGEFDGFGPASELMENGLSGKFHIMMISTLDRKGNLLKCHKLGVDNYVVKPYEIRELYEIIEHSFPGVVNRRNVAKPENRLNDLSILIVEDNKMNQKVIGTMLKCLGYSFDFADNGFAGFIQAKTRRYDVIFMDLLMPEMDGFESAQKITEYDNSILIVAFTADNLPDSRRKAELSGIREFIPKPIRIDDLKKFFSVHFLKS